MERTGFRVGSRVYWHGLSPRMDMQGQTVEAGKVTDLRQLVKWDKANEPTWVYTSAIMKFTDRCTCNWCVKQRGETEGK